MLERNADGSTRLVHGEFLRGGTTKFEFVGHGDGKTLAGLDAPTLGNIVQNVVADHHIKVNKVNLVACNSGCVLDGPSMVKDVRSNLLAGGNHVDVKGYKGRVDVDSEGHKYSPEEGGLLFSRSNKSYDVKASDQKASQENVLTTSFHRLADDGVRKSTGDESSSGKKEPQTVYRLDFRPPEVVTKQGFAGSNASSADWFNMVYGNNTVFTADSLQGVSRYAMAALLGKPANGKSGADPFSAQTRERFFSGDAYVYKVNVDGLHTTDVGNSLGFGKVANHDAVRLDKLNTESPIFKKIYEAVPPPTDAVLLKDLGELPSDPQELERVRDNVRLANAKMKAFSYFNREARYTGEVMVNGPVDPSRIELYQKLPVSRNSVSTPTKTDAAKTPKGAEKIGAWEQVGTQLGSNAGGMFKDPKGKQWYVKTSPTTDHAKNELLANKLYAAAGIRVPEAKLIVRDGEVGIASRFIDGLKPVSTKELITLNGVADGFASDAWLANWDVVGANRGNLLKQGDSSLRVDTGGALLYRARGDNKGAKFDPNAVPELDTLRDSRMNPDAGPVFSELSEEQVIASIKNVLKVSDKTIKTLCDKCGPGSGQQRKQLAKDLINRKHALADYAQGLQAQAEAGTPTSKVNKAEFVQHVIYKAESGDATVDKAAQRLYEKHSDKSVVIERVADGHIQVTKGQLRAVDGSTKFEFVGHGPKDGKTNLGEMKSRDIADFVQAHASNKKGAKHKVTLVGCDTRCDGGDLSQNVKSILKEKGLELDVKGYKGRVDVDSEGHKYSPEEGGLMHLAKDAPLNKELLKKRVRPARRGNSKTENVQPAAPKNTEQGDVKVLYGDSFQKVADKYQAVIGLRSPNPLGASLLSEGFPSKNFHVKAKSSPTGPTAGFIAEDPVYSKVSPEKHGVQKKYIAESVKKGADLVPLKLSQQRITELVNSGDLKLLGNGQYSAEYPAGTQHFSIGKDGAVSTLNGEPVRVLTNPPEVGADAHHPLPITADYDLFSISPKASQNYNLTPFKVGSRFAYGKWGEKNLPLFTSAPKNGGAEDPNMGNVSHYTRAIVQSLNKEAASEGYAGGALVWHGDEANNPFSPGFDPADQPVFFVPGKKPVRVNSKQELLKFQEMLKQEGYSPGTSNRF